MQSKFLPIVLVASMAFGAAAYAASTQTKGMIKAIDEKAMTVTLEDGSAYHLPAGFKLADLKVGAPNPFGPQPAPVGPLPPDWLAGPAATRGPGATGPIATARPTKPGGGGDDTAGVLLYVGLGILGLLIVAGLVVVAARLGRGQPLMPPLARAEPAAEPQPAEPQPDEPEQP